MSKNMWYICSKNLNTTRNKIFVVIFSTIFVVIFTAFTFMIFAKRYYYKVLQNSIASRTLMVNKNDDYEVEIPEISNLEHVSYVTEWKFNSIVTGSADYLNQEELETNIVFNPLLEKDEIKIINGRNILQDGEAICPAKFYPYNIVVNNNGQLVEKVYPNKIIKGKSLINKQLTVFSDNVENSNIEVKIVGTYDSYSNMKEMDTCYISKTDFEKMLSPYSGYGIKHHEDGTEEKKYYAHSGLLVRVDNYKNTKEVIETLRILGYTATESFNFDTNSLNFLYYIPLFIILVTTVITVSIMYNYIKKKIIYHLKHYAILLSFGFSKKDIQKINFYENIFLILISFILSIVIYLILYYIIINNLFSTLYYYSTKVNIPYIHIIIFFILLISIILLINNNILKKRINNNIYTLLGDNDDYCI